MLLRGLVIFLWLICVVVAVTATVQVAVGAADGTWVAVAFWWVVVVVLYRLDYKNRKAARR